LANSCRWSDPSKLPATFVDYNAADTKDLLDVVRKTAADFTGKLSFVKLDGVKWAEHAKSFGLSGKTPGVVVEDREHRKNYVFPADKSVTYADLKAHAQEYLDGKLQPTLKSQEIPADDGSAVKTLVGKNFESVAFDTTKDVFVEFYAPWCGHCKQLAPKYEELGKEFASTPSIIIAKVDSTENDTPAKVDGFPTLIMYPANNKKGITYDGARTAEAMADFVREHATTLGADAKKSAAPKGKEDL